MFIYDWKWAEHYRRWLNVTEDDWMWVNMTKYDWECVNVTENV